MRHALKIPALCVALSIFSAMNCGKTKNDNANTRTNNTNNTTSFRRGFTMRFSPF